MQCTSMVTIELCEGSMPPDIRKMKYRDLLVCFTVILFYTKILVVKKINLVESSSFKISGFGTYSVGASDRPSAQQSKTSGPSSCSSSPYARGRKHSYCGNGDAQREVRCKEPPRLYEIIYHSIKTQNRLCKYIYHHTNRLCKYMRVLY